MKKFFTLISATIVALQLMADVTAPVAYEATDVTKETMTAHWSPCPGAQSYTLRVYPVEIGGLVFREKFSNCTANDVYEAFESGDVTLNGHADHNGWYGTNVQGTNGGIVINNNGTLNIYGSEADLKIYRYVKKITVKFKAKPYGNDTNCKIRLASGGTAMTYDLTDTEKYYTMVIDRSYPDYYALTYAGFLFQNMTYEEGQNRVVISDFKVYFGDYSANENVPPTKYIQAGWSGDTTFVYNIPSDSTSFRFGKYINAEGNEQIDMTHYNDDYCYWYYDVKAVYANQESDWSNQIMYSVSPWPEFLEDDDDDPVVIPSEFYLVGTFNGWNQDEDGGRLVFTATDTEGVYETEGTLEDNAEFKVITPNGDGWTWYGGIDENGAGYFLINSDLLNQPITMVDGSNFRIEQGGDFTFSINANDMTLTVVPIANPTILGDVNGDGDVTSADITALYSFLLSGDMSNIVNGDQNGDGEITSADVTEVYSILLGSK